MRGLGMVKAHHPITALVHFFRAHARHAVHVAVIALGFLLRTNNKHRQRHCERQRKAEINSTFHFAFFSFLVFGFMGDRYRRDDVVPFVSLAASASSKFARAPAFFRANRVSQSLIVVRSSSRKAIKSVRCVSTSESFAAARALTS